MLSKTYFIRRSLLTATLTLAFVTPSFAAKYVVDVHGIVCEFCSFGVAKKIKKLSFIDPEQYDDGVEVDIDNQSVYFAVKAEAALDQTALFEAIKSGGYNPIKVWQLDEQDQR